MPNPDNDVARWMMSRGYATGHGDTTEDMLDELEAQVRERCAKIADNWDNKIESDKFSVAARRIAEVIRSR